MDPAGILDPGSQIQDLRFLNYAFLTYVLLETCGAGDLKLQISISNSFVYGGSWILHLGMWRGRVLQTIHTSYIYTSPANP